MKKRLLSIALLMGAWGTYGQVGIGTLTPDNSSQLDVVANDKGVLLPRVVLTSTTDAVTIANGNVNSLLVYNTNTQNDITPGYYYWYENKWMRIVNEQEVAALDKNTTNISLTKADDELVLTDSDGNIVSIPLAQINIPTILVNNNNGTYTYTNEAGDTVTIDIPSDVINTIDQILGDTQVLNQLIEVLGDTYVGGNVYYNGTQFTYIDQSGATHVINFEDIVQANETVTTLVNNNNGTYTYTSEDGTVTTVDVPGDIVNQFNNIVKDGPVTVDGNTYNTIEEYIQHLVETSETVTTLVNNNNGTYTYTSEDGTVTTVDVPGDIVNQFNNIVKDGPVTVDGNTYNTIEEYIQHLVETSETVTTLVNNNNGTYTYTSEDGTVTTVDVPGDIVNQFNNIVKDGPVTVDGNTYNTIEEYIQHLVETSETVTTLVNNNNGTYTYTSEDGTVTTVDVPGDIVNQFNNIVKDGPVTVDGNTYNTIEEYIQHLVETSETVTTLVNNNNGTYTYTSEDGTVTTVDVPGDIVNQFNNIVKDGPVTVDGNTYNTIEEYIQHLVETSETVTTLVNNNNGTYTYTSEDGTVTTVDVPGDIVNQFNNIVKDGPVTVDGNTYNTIEEYIQHLVETSETVTTLVNNNNGTYTYTSEDGTVTTVDVPGDIVNQFNNIVKDGPVTVDGNTYNTIEEYIQHLVETSETVTTLVNNNNGTYTYTSEDGTVTTVDVPGDIVNQFNNIVKDGPVTVDGNTYNTIEEYIQHLVETSETVTTLVNNNNGTYTYTSEDGTVTTVDVPGDIVNQFNNIVKDGPVTVDGNTYNTIEEYIQHLVETSETVTTLVNNNNGTYTYTSEDGTVTTVDVPGDIVNQFNNIVKDGPVTVDGNTYNTIEEYIQHLVETSETVTTLVNNNNGTYTYTSEDGTVTTVDVPGDIVNQFNNIVKDGPVTVDGNTYNTIEEYIQHLVETSETVTTLVNNNNGTYTYTSEDGTVTTVDVPGDIVNQFNNIVKDGPVTVDGNTYNTIEEYIQHLVETSETVTTLVNNNNGTYTYTSEDGTVTTVDVPGDIVNQFNNIVKDGPVTVDGNTYNTIEEYIQHLVETSETVTTLVNNNNGTYTYTSEDGTVTTVDVPGDIVNQFNNIVKDGPVTVDGNTYNTIEEYIQHLVETSETVTTLVNNNNGTYTYTSEDGTVTTVDVPGDIVNQFNNIVKDGPVTVDGNTYNTIEEYIQHLVETSETVTTLVNNNNGTYTYTSEDGTVTTVDVPGDIVNQFNNIVKDGPVTVDGNTYNTIEEYIQHLVETSETVTTLVNNNNGTYTYTSEDGTVTTVDVPGDIVNQFNNIVKDGPVTVDGNTYNTIEEYIQHLVETSETVTTLVNNNNGTYTYTSEDGTVTTVDVPGDIVNQFNNIVKDGPVTVDGNTYNTIEEYIQHLVETSETVTTLVNNNNGTYTYTSEDGTVTTVDVPGDIVNQFNNIVKDGPVTVDGNTYNTIEEYIQHLVETSETVTTLVNNNNGTYTYTSEDGTVTTVDVPGDIVNQFNNIVKDGPVTVDGNTYNTIEEYIQHLVETSETVTTLVNNNNGTYTYTSEDGTVTTVDVPGDIVNQFNNIVKDGPVTVDGNTYNTIEEYIQHLVETSETVTTLVNNNNGTYTYTSEDGTVTTVDVPGDIVNQFNNIVKDGPVTVDGNTYNTIEEYIQHLVETSETVTTLVNNNNGTYTYTSEDGTVTTVDVPGDIVNQFNNIVKDGPVTVDGNTYNTIEEYIQHLVETSETVTTLVNNNNGTYTYTSEDGTVTTVDVPGDIVNQFNNIVKDGPVTVDGNTYNTIEEYIQHLVETSETVTTLVNNNNGTYTYTSEDGTVTTVDVPGDIVNQFNNIVKDGPVTVDGNTYNTIEEYIQHLVETSETVTTLVNNNNGTYTYTSEDGTVTTVDVPGDIVNQFNNIVKDGPVTVDGNTYNTIEEYIQQLVEASETVTTLGITAGELVYVNEEANNANVNLISTDPDNGIVAGTDGALFGENIYNINGALTANRTLNLNNKFLRFDGLNRRTWWDADGRIHQTAINTAQDAAMGFHNGSSNLWIQQWNASTSSISATGSSTELLLSTHTTDASAPIRFSTSTGSGALGTERMRITGEGEIIFAEYPNTRDDSSTTSVENILYTDVNGNMLSAPIGEVAIEPWQVQTTTDKATENTDNVYQMGSVAIGTNEIPTLTVGGNDLTSTVKLHVDGNITTTGQIYTTNSVYADYVFEKYFTGHSDLNKDYQFNSLEKVNDFIKENHHLPGVTKISDLAKSENGYTFDMTALSIQQLEKIEELYLHTIEQQAQLKTQYEVNEKQQEIILQQQNELQQLKERMEKLEKLLNAKQ